jgi:hypothetical protein
MDYNKILSVIIYFFSIISFLSCSENSMTQPEETNTFFPLSVGNKWYYNSFNSYQQYDSTNVNFTNEVIGTAQVLGKSYFTVKSSYLNENGISIYSDTSQYFYSNDTLYRYMTDANKSNYYETIYANFTLGKGDKYTTYMNSTEYVITLIEKDKDFITLFYDAPQYKDEEQEITFKKGVGIYKYYTFNSGSEIRLIRAELKI